MSEGYTFPIAERFVSINGEGLRAGQLSVFIRMAGCNLACSWCDTSWANDTACSCEYVTTEQLVHWVESSPVSCVTLTGGEPALQPGLPDLIKALFLSTSWGAKSAKPRVIEIETNGSVDLASFDALRKELRARAATSFIPTVVAFTLDCKLPSSGMAAEMLPANYDLLTQGDVVKFVVASGEDMEEALSVIEKHSLPQRCDVFFSPVFSCIDPAAIVRFLEEHELSDVRLQLQLHKIIWPAAEKGV